MISLTDVAQQIDASSRLLQCTRWMQEPDHHPITDMAVRCLALYAEAIRAVDGRRAGSPWVVSQELQHDLAVALPGEVLDDMTADCLLDSYVACHLSSLVSAVRVVEIAYLEGEGRFFNRMLGEALFECLHWVESARQKLIGLIDPGEAFPVAA